MVVAILLGAAAGAISIFLNSDAEPSGSSAVEDLETPAITLTNEISLEGIVRVQNSVSVPATIEGTLENFMVEIGEEVFTGQILARINNTAIETDLKAAREKASRAEERVNRAESLVIESRLEASRANANLNMARTELRAAEKAAQRQQTLYDKGATPRLVYEEVLAEFKVKQEEYDLIREVAEIANQRAAEVLKDQDLAKKYLQEANDELEFADHAELETEVLSPVDGILTSVGADVGEEVYPEMAYLFQIAVDLSRLEVIVEPEPPVLERIRQGMPARIYLAEIPNQGIPASVKEVTNGQAVIEFVSPTPAIRPGVSAQVTITL